MNLIYIIIGFSLGMMAKYGMDKYHDFKTIEEKRSSQMEDILTKFKAIEINKNL